MKHSHNEKLVGKLAPLLISLAAAFAVYGRILGHDFLLNWDDNLYVTENAVVQGLSWQHIRAVFSSYYVGNYAPVQMFSYMLDHSIWGLSAGGFLLTNIIIHTVNSLLSYRLLLRLHRSQLFAGFAAAVFMLHPVQVESVAWISQRKNLLAMLFFLLAWEAYCRYRETEAGKGLAAYMAALAFFALALLSKSVAVIFPVVMVLHDLCFPTDDRRSHLSDKIPFTLAAVVIAAVTIISQQHELGGGRTGFHGGSPLATLFTMLPVFCRYLVMLVWPVNLSADYFPIIRQTPDLTVICSFLALTGIALATLRLFKADRRLGFWAIFFWIALIPVSQVVPLITLMNDRYLYFPMLGVAALGGAAAEFLLHKTEREKSMLSKVFLAVTLLVMAGTSCHRAQVWRDSLTLWRDAAEKSPAKPSVWANLGETYFHAGEVDKALQAYETALRLDPSNVLALYNLGVIHTIFGDLDKGQEALKKLLDIDPLHVKGWAYLGNNYLNRGDYVEAENMYKKALDIRPGSTKVLSLLGNLAIIRRDFDQARRYYAETEAKGEHDPAIAFQLACVESLAGRRHEALTWLENALQRGYRDYEKLRGYEDLSAIRGEDRFQQLLRQYFPEQEGER